jgi:hypothetical protein
MTNEIGRPKHKTTQREPVFSPASSLAFWCCLVASVTLFAAVSLSPRLRAHRELEREHAALQRTLVAQERQVDYLRKVVNALKNDPEYAREMARVAFGDPADGERFSVDSPLMLRPTPEPEAAAIGQASAPTPRWVPDTPMIDVLADNHPVRRSLLGASALLVIVGFTFFCGSPSQPDGDAQTGSAASFRGWFFRRYARGNDRPT